MPIESTLNLMRSVPYWWEGIADLPLVRQATQRILLVADGALNYSPDSDLGLSLFVAELEKFIPPPVISRAHRGNDGTADPGQGGFIFSEASLRDFNQVWLFGLEGKNAQPPLSDAEFKALADFMIAGGGVFATGDHEDLGFAMGGELFRVRKMRDWSSIPAKTDQRIDTVTNPGPDRQARVSDQADELPQRIFPHFYKCEGSWLPHPLLRSSAGDVDVMPDHPHESECLEGSNLGDRYLLHGLDLEEFPRHKGVPLAPQLIATSVSAGRFLTDLEVPPTKPRVFGSISVWNGHLVGQGRIACDSSWHHFVNINLKGLKDADFQQVAQYYRNIAGWIGPVDSLLCVRFIELLIERYRMPLVEELRPLPSPSSLWEPRVQAGAVVEGALNANRGRGFAEEIATTALEMARLGEFADLVRPVPAEDVADNSGQLISAGELRRGVLGSIFDAFVRNLPSNPSELPEVLEAEGREDAPLARAVIREVGHAADAANTFFAQSADETLGLINRTVALRAKQLATEADTP